MAVIGNILSTDTLLKAKILEDSELGTTVLATDEMGISATTREFKIGDGTKNFNELNAFIRFTDKIFYLKSKDNVEKIKNLFKPTKGKISNGTYLVSIMKNSPALGTMAELGTPEYEANHNEEAQSYIIIVDGNEDIKIVKYICLETEKSYDKAFIIAEPNLDAVVADLANEN